MGFRRAWRVQARLAVEWMHQRVFVVPAMLFGVGVSTSREFLSSAKA